MTEPDMITCNSIYKDSQVNSPIITELVFWQLLICFPIITAPVWETKLMLRAWHERCCIPGDAHVLYKHLLAKLDWRV